MSSKAEYTLRDFVRELVATPEEWQEWEQVSSAKPAGTRPVMPKTAREEIYHEKLPETPEFLRKQELERQFVERARELLNSVDWDVTGRHGGSPIRIPLEPVDLRGPIDFTTSAIGPFRRVQVQRSHAKSKTEVLTRFVEMVCLAAGNPGTQLKKDSIRELARHLCAEHFSTTAFAAAWDEAHIDVRWRKSGPR